MIASGQSGFRGVHGHSAAVALLRRAIAQQRVSSVYLFAGPAGVGKDRVAHALAQTVNCRTPIDGDACGTCDLCQKIAAGSHPDVILVQRELRDPPDLFVRQAAAAQSAREKHAAWRRQEVPESELKQLISVEQIEQQVLARMPFRPHEAATRWVIVREAERMPPAVANKLLKTLEESPRDTHFVLLTHKPSALLSTIRSRCQIVRFGLLSENEIVAVLHELGLDDGVARQLVAWGDGSVGRALEFRDQALHHKRQHVVDEVLAALRVGNAAAYVTMAEKTKTFDRRDLETVLLLLQRYFRGETLQHAGVRPRHAAVNASRADIVRETQELLDSSANYNVQLTLEAMMVRLREVRA